MQETLKIRQSNIAHVNETYASLSRDSEQSSSKVPEHVQQRMDSLNSDWIKIQKLAGGSSSSSPSYKEDVRGEAIAMEGTQRYYCTL